MRKPRVQASPTLHCYAMALIRQSAATRPPGDDNDGINMLSFGAYVVGHYHTSGDSAALNVAVRAAREALDIFP